MRRFFLILYNLILPVVLLVSFPGYFRRMRKRGGYRKNFGQRFGYFSSELRHALGGGGWSWIRAVSVGEMVQALSLAEELKRQDKTFRAVISTTTSTGYALGQQRSHPEWLQVIYSPVDFYPIVARVWRLLQPRELILVDSDLWPSFLACARAHGAPVHLVNARLSPRSRKRYEALRSIAEPLLWRQVTRVYAQHPNELGQWLAVGLDQQRVTAMGSLKYDATPPVSPVEQFAFREWLRQHGCEPKAHRFLLGGSLHPGEEEMLLKAFLQLRTRFPDLFLILVPRHVERTPEIVELLETYAVPWTLRSKPEFAPGTAILVVDSTGELRGWYTAADVVVIGKSFHGIGGQNPVEPIQALRPVIAGPHMENFATLMRELVAAGGLRQLSYAEQLPAAVADLLDHPDQAAAMVERAGSVLAFHRGATVRIAASILAARRKNAPGS
jgi:3-deoxy-D-manno-octulosonic-acid transferase